jgi:hypothetical protein
VLPVVSTAAPLPRIGRGCWRTAASLSFLLLLAAVVLSCSTPAPHVSVASERIPRHWPLQVQGSGFTPQHNITSHLIRADGSEFPVLPILTDRDGKFTHTIDTMILELGKHELWVVDDATGRTSNHVTFEVTFDYPKNNDSGG